MTSGSVFPGGLDYPAVEVVIGPCPCQPASTDNCPLGGPRTLQKPGAMESRVYKRLFVRLGELIGAGVDIELVPYHSSSPEERRHPGAVGLNPQQDQEPGGRRQEPGTPSELGARS